MLGTIGLFLRSNDNDYQQRLKEVGLREAKKQGFEIAIESAQNDANRQVEQIHAAIKNAANTKLAAILVSTVRDDVLPDMVREAAEAGIDWALLNEGMFIDEIRAQYPNRAIFVVTPDQLEIGRIHGRQVRTLVGNAGKVLCVTGPLNAVTAKQRLDGLKEILADDFSLIELNADWTSERARMAVGRWAVDLTSDSELPGMFVAHNDEMALGVRQALRDVASQKDLPLGAAFITGCDGSQTFGQRLVREGRLKATVIMPPASGAAIEWIARIRTKSEQPPVRVVQPVTSFPAASGLKR
ncbi:MAG TPA: sugar ABC transporter substrate-binding protein [Polyangia bacterium]|jgi:ABC-type sugar transport system substrate-binding protein